jgi:aldehyde:ferredoxin oxidoreductase
MIAKKQDASRILEVNLTHQRFTIQEKKLDDMLLIEKLGGLGLGMVDYYYHLLNNPGLLRVDALDPGNPIYIMTGCFTGSNLMTGLRTLLLGKSYLKTHVDMLDLLIDNPYSEHDGILLLVRDIAAKNKLLVPSFNGGVYFSAASGDFGTELRGNNLVGVKVIGKSDHPVYLALDKGHFSLEDATDMVGLGVSDKIYWLNEHCNKENKGFAFTVIGPSGEKLVRFASNAFSTKDDLQNHTGHHRYAGGFGAAFGAKGLLGVAARGDREYFLRLEDVVDTNKMIGTGKSGLEVDHDGNITYKDGTKTKPWSTKKYHDLGTHMANNLTLDALGVSIINNYTEGKSENTLKLDKDYVLESGLAITDKGCTGCLIKCWKQISEKDTNANKEKIHGKIDWENTALLGTNLGLSDMRQIVELINLCDEYCVDSMEMGSTIGYIMYVNSLDSSTSDLSFGNFGYAKWLLHNISKGKHPGMDGAFRYSLSVDPTRYDPFCMSVKGKSIAAYHGKYNPGIAFSLARDHMTMATYNKAYGAKGKDGNTVFKNSLDDWVKYIIDGSGSMLFDLDGMCKFSQMPVEVHAKYYNQLYDSNITAADLKLATQYLHLLMREIDNMLGFTPDDDRLPESCYEPLPDAVIPHFLTPDFFTQLKSRVYEEYRKIEDKLLAMDPSTGLHLIYEPRDIYLQHQEVSIPNYFYYSVLTALIRCIQ